MLWPLIAIWVVAFPLIVFALWQLFYRQADKTRARLEALYQDNVRRESELARLREEAEREMQAKVAEAEEAIRHLKAEADFELQHRRDEALAAAKSEGERLIAEAKAIGERQQARLIAEANEKAVALAATIIKDLFASKVAYGVHHHLVEGLIEEVGTLNGQRFPAGVETVEVIVPFPLSPAQRDTLTASISSKTGRLVTLKESTDGALIAGMVLKLDRLVLDGSLQHKLQETLAHVRENLA